MISFLDDHRGVYGVEPICKVLPIAPSTYYNHVFLRANPEKRSARALNDEALAKEILRVWDENFQVYGIRKIWRQLLRENICVARCTVERLMRKLGLRGVVRGKKVKTTIADRAQPCPLDRVNRQFKAKHPNTLWVSDFTYVSTWQGFVYVAFVIDAFARRIVGWRVSSSARTDFVLDALEQALHERQPVRNKALVHHFRSRCPVCFYSIYLSVWPKLALSRRWEVLVTLMIMPWPRLSMDYIKPRLFTEGRGNAEKL